MRPKKRILLVDADDTTLSVRKYLLTVKGYAVTCAANSADAIALYSTGSFDIVIAELAMPEVDGNQLIGILKGIRPEIPMMLVSDSVRMGERIHRADCFMAKGTMPGDLMERVRIFAQRKRGPKKSVISEAVREAERRMA